MGRHGDHRAAADGSRDPRDRRRVAELPVRRRPVALCATGAVLLLPGQRSLWPSRGGVLMSTKQGDRMKPLRIRVNRLIDFGAIVTLIGVDAEASKPVTVHVDYRPFDVVWAAWRDIGSKQPIEYAADGLTLSLGGAADDPIQGALIGEPPILKPAMPNP